MIYVSEVVLKPIFGEDIFSKDRVKYCENYNPPTGEVLFVEDSFGFTAELKHYDYPCREGWSGEDT